MNSNIRKAGLKCPVCDAELLVNVMDGIVFCQMCDKRVRPDGPGGN